MLDLAWHEWEGKEERDERGHVPKVYIVYIAAMICTKNNIVIN